MAVAYHSISPMGNSMCRTPSPSYLKAPSPKFASLRDGGPNIDISHARNVYNPARNMVYARFSDNDWSNSNKAHYMLSDRERSQANNLRADAWRAVKETDDRTRRRQAENTKKLANRRDDIHFWKQELLNEIRAMENETENLQEHKRVLEKAYMATANPLHIAEECLLHREKRTGIDQVHDDVEKELVKEVDIIKKCQEKMKRCIQKAHIQLKLNRAALHECEKDAKDKHHAQNIDDRMHQLRNSSIGIGYYPGIENVDNTLSVPYSWVKFTQNNIARSQRERAASERLRGEIDACLRACANAMWSQFNSVNNAFNTRIRETTDARDKLQAHLQRVMQEIMDMDRNIELLRKAIRDKEAYMKVAQTRLEERTKRLNVELCKDHPMKGLAREVHEIRESVRYLKDKLRASEIQMARLMKTKSQIETDIGVKENSLAIDGKACMGLRKTFPSDGNVGPIFNMPLVR